MALGGLKTVPVMEVGVERSNIEYGVGRNTGLELEDLNSSPVCYLLDYRKLA